MTAPTRQPLATYRLQLHAGFTFEDAIGVTDYLAQLGVTHAYTSPILQAAAGSMHGYDVVDPTRLNPELKPELYDRWIDALHAHDMGHLLDIVPNHMGIETNENPWWNDLLRHGPQGPHGAFFDVDWGGTLRASMAGKVLLPVLGKPYGRALSDGELRLVREGREALVAYYDKRFPLRDDPGDLDAFNADAARLDDVLGRQHYRLAYWRCAGDEVNYRRFFNINALAALAMERREVFDAAHRLIFKLIDEGKVDGLRVDHPDGLYDPGQYFERLQEGRNDHLYVVVEKILEMDESLDPEWPVDGTSGYDFLAHVNALFVDRANEPAFSAIYDEFVGRKNDFHDIARDCKREILDTSMAGQLHALAVRLDRAAQEDPITRDYTLAQFKGALRETIAWFGVYRTYISGRRVGVFDAEQIELAVDRAQASARDIEPEVFRFVGDTLLRDAGFAGRFQQLTGPVTAKGVEDTAFYRYHRLISLNEVGSDPARFGLEPDDLHDWFIERQRRWAGALSTLSTHDTKRSEDVRARINVLSEMPGVWRDALHALHDGPGDGIDRNDAYLLYQTLIGAWPIDAQRLQQYMTKALREGGQRTSWTSPDAGYEADIARFIDRVLATPEFIKRIEALHQRIAPAGWLNSLAQTVIKLWAPGVPDTYQGTEMLDLSLVDPDNRRCVDYAARAEALRRVDAGQTPKAAEKLLVIARSLRHRRLRERLCREGAYEPIRATRHVFAFARVLGEQFVLVVVPRLTSGASGEAWRRTSLPLPPSLQGRRARSLFDGREAVLGSTAAPHDLIGGLGVAVWVDGAASGVS